MTAAPGRLARTLAVVTTLVGLGLSSTACSTAFTFGARPPVEHLARLVQGTSTDEEVRKVLGEPRGRGHAHLAVGSASVWLYDSGEGSAGGDMRNRILLVFLRDGRFDGYLWYDAELKMKERQ